MMLRCVCVGIIAIISYVILYFVMLKAYFKESHVRLANMPPPSLTNSEGISNQKHIEFYEWAVGQKLTALDSTLRNFRSSWPPDDTHKQSRDTLMKDSESIDGEPRKSNEPQSERVIRILVTFKSILVWIEAGGNN